MDTDTTPLTPTPPPPPTEVRDVTALMERINKRLPEGYSMSVLSFSDNGIELVAEGFTFADDDHGTFVPAGVTLDPEHTLNVVVDLNAVEIPDVFIDGRDLRELIQNSANEALFGDLDSAHVTPINADVLSVDDVWASVEFDAQFDYEVTLRDLGIEGDEDFASEDEAVGVITDMLVRHIADEFVCSPSDVTIEITADDIGL